MRSCWRFVFIALFSCSLFYGVSVYADYDISSIYRKTEFNSTKWIQTSHNLTIDNLSELIYLNTAFLNDYEDLSEYYLYDELPAFQNYITVHNDTWFTSYINDRDETNYLRYNYSVNPISKIDLGFWFKYNSSINASYSHIMTFANEENGFRDAAINGTEYITIKIRRVEALPLRTHILLVHKANNTYAYEDIVNPINFNQWYYVNMFRYGQNVTVNMFTEKAMTNRVVHLTYGLLNASVKYDYFYPISTNDVPQTGYDLDVDIINLINNETLNAEVYVDAGVLYTKDLLANTTEKNLMIGINGTAQANTQVRLYGSPDNSTWELLIDNNGFGELMQYREILYNYSSLYARLNLTTSDTSITPYVDELFYLRTYECVAGSGTKPYVFIIIFTIIGLILGYRIDRT